MRTLSLISLLIASLLLAGCVTQPTPEPPKPTIPEGPAATEVLNTPTPDPVSTPTPQVRQLPDGRTYKQYAVAPLMTIDPDATYLAHIRTNKGDITLELFASEAPKTVNNFVFLAREGFYNGISFHRVMKEFMIQTGDPKGNGSGGPGYRFADEPVSRSYSKGIVAMANAGPNTNGSQFFIVHGAQITLPPSYTIFGQVTGGLDTVDAIADSPVQAGAGGEVSSPLEPIIVDSIEITGR